MSAIHKLMKLKTAPILLLLVAAFLFAGCTAESGNNNTVIPLQFNLHKDSTLQYLVKSHIELTPDMGENSVTIDQDMTIATSLGLLSKTDNTASLSIVYDRLILSSGGDAINTEFDTDNDDGSIAIFQGIRDLIHKPFSMTISKEGSILDNGTYTQGQQIISDSSFRKVLTQALYIYPTAPVKIGDTWQYTFKTSIGFLTMTVTNNYKLMFLNKDIAHIEISSRLSSDSSTQMGNANMSLSGIQSGSMDIRISSGTIMNGKFDQQMSGSIDFGGKETPVTINSNIYIMGTEKTKPLNN